MRAAVEHSTVAYADQVCAALWPRSSHEPGRALVALPSPERPRMLVPAAPARVAAAAVRSLAADRSVRGRLRREGAAVGLRLGAARALSARGRTLTVGTGGVDAHLSAALGQQVVAGVLVGAPRANRKPVLVLLDPRGAVVGFAKVGSTPLTRELVAREADALASLAGCDLPGVVVPRLLHRSRWADLDVVVQSPLDTAGAARPAPALLHGGLRVIAATSLHAGTGAVLRELAGWRATVSRLETSDDPVATSLHRSARLLGTRAARPVPSGAWHGDLTPWNTGVVQDRLLVWDWERYEDGVPVGYDALHHELAVLTQVQGLDHEPAARQLLERAERVVGPVGVPADAAEVVGLAYLITLGTRYLLDGQAAAGHRSGQLERWLLPLLAARLGAGAAPR